MSSREAASLHFTYRNDTALSPPDPIPAAARSGRLIQSRRLHNLSSTLGCAALITGAGSHSPDCGR
jgi:hypothetical protein